MNVQNRTIFSNDNLPVLRGIDTESIDLIYLDPPFNSNRNYAAPIGEERAINCPTTNRIISNYYEQNRLQFETG
ncbi:hypothetical protein F4009_04295 [Candidatus Poribacteria bacterium]|nr:hypothetical protein [Candidatus Poribacteria bacterium]MYH79985.1 hypothetical protein [Candidatus Poribacteria bacterium]MYK93211.1 hypothetical protein [Candidatus Poribacteria bacterium]